MNKERLVQCHCSYNCNLQYPGYQWILPKIKDKHLYYEKTIQWQKEQQQSLETDIIIDTLGKQLASISIHHRAIKKKKQIPLLPTNKKNLTVVLKGLQSLRNDEDDCIMVLKEFTVIKSKVEEKQKERQPIIWQTEYY